MSVRVSSPGMSRIAVPVSMNPHVLTAQSMKVWQRFV
jgi:hypothetical protein